MTPDLRSELEYIYDETDDTSVADEFAYAMETHIAWSGTADDYFASIKRFPPLLRKLYCALMFNTSVCSDGLADTIPKYDEPMFWDAMCEGLALLGQQPLQVIIERARGRLRDPASKALMSKTPNVALNAETGDIHHDYFAANKQLMPQLGAFLRANRESVLDAAMMMGP